MNSDGHHAIMIRGDKDMVEAALASCARLKTGMDSIGLNVTIMSGRSTCVLCDHGDSVRDVCEEVAHLLGMSAITFVEKGRLVHGIDEVHLLSVFEPGLIHEVSLVLSDP